MCVINMLFSYFSTRSSPYLCVCCQQLFCAPFLPNPYISDSVPTNFGYWHSQSRWACIDVGTGGQGGGGECPSPTFGHIYIYYGTLQDCLLHR